MEQTIAQNKNAGLLYGVIAGLALVILQLCLYLAGVSAYLGAAGWLKYPLIILIAVLAAQKVKKSGGGFLPFGEALKVIFIVFAIGFLFDTLFGHILFNYIDTGFRDAIAQASMEKMATLLKKMGAPPEKIEEAMEKGISADTYSLKNVLLGYAFQCIIAFLFALLIAAIVKKNKPMFDNNAFNQ